MRCNQIGVAEQQHQKGDFRTMQNRRPGSGPPFSSCVIPDLGELRCAGNGKIIFFFIFRTCVRYCCAQVLGFCFCLWVFLCGKSAVSAQKKKREEGKRRHSEIRTVRIESVLYYTHCGSSAVNYFFLSRSARFPKPPIGISRSCTARRKFL